MAHIDDNSGGGRRNVAIDINIVPFIDLMSTLIIFLLITAVWSQVSMIQIGSSIYGKKTEQETATPPPRAEIPFRVDVLNSGYRVLVGKNVYTIPLLQVGSWNTAALKEKLVQVKESYPEKVDAVITMQDDLAYEHLIDGMDALLNAGFPEISIATGGAR